MNDVELTMMQANEKMEIIEITDSMTVPERVAFFRGMNLMKKYQVRRYRYAKRTQ